MKKLLRNGILSVITGAVLVGCGAYEKIVDKFVEIDDYDEIVISNNVDISQCSSSGGKSSRIAYFGDSKTCEDYGRTDGDHCSVHTGNISMSGDTTCVLGYDN